jgi:ELWxxDGT repeat protein
MVKELFPGGPLFQETLVVGGVLYFTATANHYNSGDMELWRSDGTADGTYVVADVNPNGSSFPVWLRDFGDGHVGFVADDGVHGKEPWISDGTPEGTKVININTTTPPVVDDPPPSAGGAGGAGGGDQSGGSGAGGTTEPSTTVPAETRSARETTALAPTPAPAPPALTLTVTKKADAALPFRYAGHGALSARGSCAGTVTVSLARGARTVGRATAKVAKDCTYRATVGKATMKDLARKGGRLTIAARFNGNAVVAPVRSPAATVRYGRS